MFHYLLVVSPGPFIVIRVPMEGKPGRRKLVIRWRTLVKALTPIMHTHGLRAKDISMIDNVSHPDEWDPDLKSPYLRPLEVSPERLAEMKATMEKAEAAFAGGTNFPRFWLYDWNDADDRFDLARRPLA